MMMMMMMMTFPKANINEPTYIYVQSILIKTQLAATVCSLIYFTAKSLYMFRVSTAPIITSTKNCNRSLRYSLKFMCSHSVGSNNTCFFYSHKVCLLEFMKIWTESRRQDLRRTDLAHVVTYCGFYQSKCFYRHH